MSENKAFELRKLTAEDMFPMFQIISKIGIKEFKDCFYSPEIRNSIKKDGKLDIESVGLAVAFDIAGILLSHLPAAKNDIYTLLSGLSGMDKKEIAALDMAVFAEMIIAVIKKDEFKDFFAVVSGLLK